MQGFAGVDVNGAHAVLVVITTNGEQGDVGNVQDVVSVIVINGSLIAINVGADDICTIGQGRQGRHHIIYIKWHDALHLDRVFRDKL